MKFVYFGYDFSFAVLERLIQDGHEPLALFSFETDNIFSFNTTLQAVAQGRNISFHSDPVVPDQIALYASQGATLFIAAGYPHKIPALPANSYGINLHPTLLPHGKGIMPMPALFLKHPEYSGITLHKITDEFDAGDILLQQPVPINDSDDVQTLSARIAMRSPDLVAQVTGNLKHYWDNAKPQGEGGGWWKAPGDDVRTFDWTQTVADIQKRIKAFGGYGMLADFDGQRWAVFQSKAWAEAHNHNPGDIALRLNRETVIAVADGFVMLKQYQPLEPQQFEPQQ